MLFSDVPKEALWSNSLKGWSWVPRTMPLILQAIRLMSKGTSAAETYFALWCNSLSESIVEMDDKPLLIAAAGYNGPSNERTWKERMKKLVELGFIKIASGKHGEISCVLIMNPHKVLQRLKAKRTAGLDEKLYNTIMEQMINCGMLDFLPAQTQAPMPLVLPLPTAPPQPQRRRKQNLEKNAGG
jgi:hypothetical protein